MNFVELLAPARDLQSAVAAVDYGADAVYIGGGQVRARHAAGARPRQLNRVFAPRGQSFLAGLQGRRERKAPVSRIAHT